MKVIDSKAIGNAAPIDKWVDAMEQALRQAARNDEQEVSLIIDNFKIDNLRQLARKSRGKAKKNVA